MKIAITIKTDKVGSQCKRIVDFVDWDTMTAEEHDEVCKEVAFDMVEWFYEEL